MSVGLALTGESYQPWLADATAAIKSTSTLAMRLAPNLRPWN